eukprot:3221838-Rhodomonas_salina.4
MPGTGIAYAAIALRARYAMFGTDIAHQVLGDRGDPAQVCLLESYDGTALRAPYARSGTDTA